MKQFFKIVFSIALLGLLTSAGWADGETYTSTTGGTHALSVTSDATYTNITVTKTGDVSGQSDDYDWKGTNAAVHASGGAKLVISGSSTNISSNASYGNAVFSYGGNNSNNNNNQGDGTTITISDATITTSKNNSGGIMTTGGGIMNATNLTITTSGGSSAAIRTDSGGGTVTVDGGTYTTNGQGSPAIYSTAAITVTGADLTSNVAQVVVIEGGNSVTLNNSNLTAHHTKKNGQDTTYQAVLIYKSMSKDASSGTSYFTMNGGTLTSTQGAIFHVTNTNTVIALNGVTITNNDSENLFLNATSDSWGNSGSNGGTVTLNATNQTINGNMIVDSVSSLNMTLSGTSTFNGAINSSTSSNGSVTVKIESGSTWNMTGNSTVTSLTNNGTIYYGAYTLTVNGTAYNASNPYSGGSGSSSDDDDDETVDYYPDALSIVLNSDGTATYDGTSVTDYGFVWHCEPSSIDEYFTASSTSTQAYTEDEILENTGASEQDVYIAHDVRYLTSNANFTGATATNGMDSEYVAYYDASAVQNLEYYNNGTEYIFATLPTQFMGSGGGMGGMPEGNRSGDMPGGMPGGAGSGDRPGEPPSGGPGGGIPPSFSSAFARDLANSGNVAAFDYMTHTADEAYSNPVLHIQEPGTYKLSGTWHGQIWVDVGKNNKITLVLNGVEVSCDVGPAIVFYKAYECEPYDDEAADTAKEAAELTATASFDVEDLTIEDAGVLVVLADGKTNKFTGSNTPRMLTTAIKSDASTIDGSDYKQQKKRYKLDGAFHSTRSMVISGDGALSVTSTTSEGLDTEMHLTIIGGSIDVTAPDDGINVNEDYVSVFTFDCGDPSGGSLSVTSTGADGIDSNGYVILKSGTLRIYTANQEGAEGAIDSLDELGSNGKFTESNTSILDYQWGSYSGGSGGGTQPGGDFPRGPGSGDVPGQPGSGDVPGGSGGNTGGASSDATLKITTTNVSDAAVNSVYNFTIRVVGSGALTWSASGLPSGLTINSSTGQITGTPTTTGTYNFVVTVTDSTGATASQNFTMTVNAEGSAVAPVIISKTLQEGAVGYAYYDEISATGTQPINWDFYNNTILPEGLSLISSQSIAVISGSPRVSGTYTFELSATNSVSSDHKEFTIRITDSLEAPVITTNALNPGIVNSNYTATLSATGSSPITWSISNGSLPTGINLIGNTLSGIPTTAGTYNFTVTATNNAGTASKDFTLTINAEGYTPSDTETAPTITTTSLATGQVGEYYSATLNATGSSPITWSVISGELPDGLDLNSSTGVISGYPEASYTYSFTVRATNSAGSAERELSISIYSNNNYTNNSGIYRHSSSGGCNGGFSIMGLALVAIFARKKK